MIDGGIALNTVPARCTVMWEFRPIPDVDADAILPGRGSVADLLAEIGTAGVRRRGDLSIRLPAGAGVLAGAGAEAGAGAKAGLPCT